MPILQRIFACLSKTAIKTQKQNVQFVQTLSHQPYSCHKANFGPLTRRQPPYRMLIIILFQVRHRECIKVFSRRMWRQSVLKEVRQKYGSLKIFLLYFHDAGDVNLSEKKFGRCTAHSYRANVAIEFHYFMKKEKTQLKTKEVQQNICKSMGIYRFS